MILREIEFPKDVLITVTGAEVTPDLKESKVYVSAIPEKNEEQVLALLNRKVFLLQKKIDKRLKMRPVPKISFVQEKRTVEAGRIEEILSSLNLNRSNSDSPQPLVERLDQIGIKNKRRPSPFAKRGCPKGDRRGAKRVHIWEKLKKEQK